MARAYFSEHTLYNKLNTYIPMTAQILYGFLKKTYAWRTRLSYCSLKWWNQWKIYLYSLGHCHQAVLCVLELLCTWASQISKAENSLSLYLLSMNAAISLKYFMGYPLCYDLLLEYFNRFQNSVKSLLCKAFFLSSNYLNSLPFCYDSLIECRI